jgi:biotin carboxylase
MNKRIMIFGGGDTHQPLLRACKELGYHIVVTDPLKKPLYAHLADKLVVLDPNDHEGHRQVIQQENIGAIATCGMESPLFLMADLAQEFGFIFPSPEVVRAARDKFLMKQKFLEHGVPCARGVKIERYEELEALDMSEWEFPLILKPVDGTSSRGVFRIEDREQLLARFWETTTFSSNGEVIVEEFMSGPQIGTENITYNGETTVVQTTGYICTPYPYFVELELYQPANFPAETIERVKEVVKQAHKAIGLDNCGTNTELIITPSGPKVVEIAGRLGGDHVASYLPLLSTGVDMCRALAQIVMGDKPDLNFTRNRFSSIRYFNWTPGARVASTRPIAEFKRHPLVAHAALKFDPGDILPPVTESAHRHSFFITSANTRAELVKNVEILMKEISGYMMVEPVEAPRESIYAK